MAYLETYGQDIATWRVPSVGVTGTAVTLPSWWSEHFGRNRVIGITVHQEGSSEKYRLEGLVPATQRTIDNAAAVNAGGGYVDIPCTSHGFLAGSKIQILNTKNYNGKHTIYSAPDVNTIRIAATHVAETFAGTELLRGCEAARLTSDGFSYDVTVRKEGGRTICRVAAPTGTVNFSIIAWLE